MMFSSLILPLPSSLLLLSLICCVTGQAADQPHKRFQYKYSFKPPKIVTVNQKVPFWEYAGDTIAGDEQVRVVASLRGQKGLIFTSNKTNFKWFEVDVAFRVTGRGRIGADGLGIWFTENIGTIGPVYGSNDYWKGLGIFFDSFDNDGKHNNPYILAVQNDGTKHYDHTSDGDGQQLGGCMQDFRNKPFLFRARIRYFKNRLSLLINSGLTANKEDFKVCTEIESVVLPEEFHLGISAATGGLADDHDVISVHTYSLQEESEKVGVQDEKAQEKYDKEFEEYMKSLEEAKKEFKEKHPDRVKDTPWEDWDEENSEGIYQGDEQRELVQLYQVQSEIKSFLIGLDQKVDLIAGQVRSFQSGGTGAATAGADSYKLDNLITSNRELGSSFRDFKNVLNDVQSKANTIHLKVNQQPVGNPIGGDSGNPLVTHEIKDSLKELRDMLSSRDQSNQRCPTTTCPDPPSCVSTMMFLFIILLQSVGFVVYIIVKARNSASSKKLY